MELVVLFFSHMQTVCSFLGIGQHVNLGTVYPERHATMYDCLAVYPVSCHIIRGWSGNVASVARQILVGQRSDVELSCRL